MKFARVIPLLLLFACQRERAEEMRQPSPMGPQLSGTTPKHMRNCPSAVATAKTVATPTPDGVDVTITSDDPAARRQIVELARWHAVVGEPIWGMPPHTGMHGGPGTIGVCPIIHAKTIVTSEEIPAGVRIHVHAIDPTMAPRLQQITQLRVQALSGSV